MDNVTNKEHPNHVGYVRGVEIRNQLPHPIAFRVVKVVTTDNLFIYIKPLDDRTDQVVEPGLFESVEVTESQF